MQHLDTGAGLRLALTMSEMPHVMVVDDDTRLRELLRKYLSDHGYVVTVAKDAPDARSKLEMLAVDLMILDVMMPGEDGLSLATDLSGKNGPPILLLTAQGEADDRIRGLESGADDYLVKPFDPRELLLRMGKILRRKPPAMEAGTQSSVLRLGMYLWDGTRQELRRNDEVIRLTTGEGQLMAALAQAVGEAVSRDDLARATGYGANPRAVDVQVTRLRRKVEEDPKNPRYLQTVRGQGYMLRPD